jgi:hypothetical protein
MFKKDKNSFSFPICAILKDTNAVKNQNQKHLIFLFQFNPSFLN